MRYLHAVIEQGCPAEHDVRSGLVPGMESAPATVVSLDGLVAVVSPVSPAHFGEAALNAMLKDLSLLAPFAVRHEDVIRLLLPGAPSLVPAAFGTVYEDASGVLSLLAARGDPLRAALQWLRGKTEWGVKVFLHREQLEEAVDQRSEHIRQLAQQEREATPGRAYLLRRQRSEARLRETDRTLEQALHGIVARLRATCADLRVEPVPAPPAGGGLVLRAAVLVDEASAADLPAHLEALNAAHRGHGLTLEVNGPWAPYSFVAGAMGGAGAP